MPHLSISIFFNMIFEHLWNYFHLENSASEFAQLFQLCSHITQGDIPHWIAHVFGAARLLTLTKALGGVRPIVVGKILYQLMSYTLCLQFQNAFVTHFSPHQFGIVTKGGCETTIHGIRCILDIHLIRLFSNLM
jgi:hypothetical protein